MFITLKKEVLSRCLNIAAKALPPHSTIPVLENILFESCDGKLTFTTTNLELEIKVALPYSDTETGKILLPRKTVDIIHHLPAPDVEMNINLESLRFDLNSGPTKFNLYGADAGEYPIIEAILPAKDAVSINRLLMKQVLKTVVFAASTDDSRPAFNGVLFLFKEKGITLISSDTYRLVVKKISDERWDFEEKKYLVPARSLRELLKILDEESSEVTIFPHQKQVAFNLGPVYFATRVLEEKYPDVSGVIPARRTTRLIVERKLMDETIGRAALLAEGVNQPVQLSAGNNQLSVRVSSQVGRMEEILPVHQEGEEIEIYVNSRFIADILKVVDLKEIIIDFHGKNGPIIFRMIDDETYLYLVLPIKME